LAEEGGSYSDYSEGRQESQMIALPSAVHPDAKILPFQHLKKGYFASEAFI
jgi:hypothetical protein